MRQLTIILIITALTVGTANAQKDTVEVPGYYESAQKVGTLNEAIQTAKDNGTISSTVFKLKPYELYVLSKTISIEGDHHLEIVAPEPLREHEGTPEEVQNSAPPQIVWTDEEGIDQTYIINTRGDLTLKNVWVRYTDFQGNQLQTGIVFEDSLALDDKERGTFEGVIFDYSQIGSEAGGAVTVKSDHFSGIFRNCYFRNNIDMHFRYYGRAVSFPYQSTGYHYDSLLFENTTFANISRIVMQEFDQFGDNIHLNHCTILNTVEYVVQTNYDPSGLLKNISITNSIIVNPSMYGYRAVDVCSEDQDYDDFDNGACSSPRGGLFDVAPVDTFANTPFVDFTDEDRKILLSHTSYGYKDYLKDWYTQCDWCQERIQDREKDLLHHPFPYLSEQSLQFMNARDEDGNKLYPSMSVDESTLYLDQVPGFITPATNRDTMLQYVEYKWSTNEDINWAYKPGAGYNQQWPLPENMAYSNTTFQNAAMGNYPLGDLYHWYPEQYEDWRSQRSDEWQQIDHWLENGKSSQPSYQTVGKWGSIDRHGWAVSNVTESGATISGSGPPTDDWATIRGGFIDTLTIEENKNLMVRGKMEIQGGALSSRSPLRFGVFHHDSAGSLQYTGTDSVRWTGNEGPASGYLFTPRSDTNPYTDGMGGLGTQWATKDGIWLSTNNDSTITLGTKEQLPQQAVFAAGTYDFAISVHPQNDGSNEVRWYLIHDEQTYGFMGSAVDTGQVTTAFNGISFAVNYANGIAETGVTGLKLSEVTASLTTDPIELPDRIPVPYYVTNWGSMGGRDGWPVLNDTTTDIGNAIMGAEGPPQGSWATIRGGFDNPFIASRNKAVVVTGQIELEGGFTDVFSPLRFGLFRHDSAGALEDQYTDSARWTGSEAGAHGYLFTPQSGSMRPAGGSNGLGSSWAVRNGSWINTWNTNTYPFGNYKQAPRHAELTAGVYDLAISVQPLADGTNEVKWYLVKEDTSYWYAGRALDTAQVTTEFNGITFGVTNEFDPIASNVHGLNINSLVVEHSDPITLPEAPDGHYLISDWGLLKPHSGDWKLTPAEQPGNTMISGDTPPDEWIAVRGNFNQPMRPENDHPLNVTGTLTLDGGGFEDQHSLQFGIMHTQQPGRLDSVMTSGFIWPDDQATYNGYLFLPLSGDASYPEWGSRERGTAGGIINGSPIRIDQGGSYTISTEFPSPEDAVGGPGEYNFGITIHPRDKGAQLIKFKMAKRDTSYVFADSVVDRHAPLAATRFNSVVFATRNSSTTSLTLQNVNYNTSTFEIPRKPTDIESEPGLPAEFTLEQNYPNPFNPTTQIKFALPKATKTTLEVYNLIGQRVATLVNSELKAGYHQVSFNGQNLASGVYLYRIEAGDFVSNKKMLLIK